MWSDYLVLDHSLLLTLLPSLTHSSKLFTLKMSFKTKREYLGRLLKRETKEVINKHSIISIFIFLNLMVCSWNQHPPCYGSEKTARGGGLA